MNSFLCFSFDHHILTEILLLLKELNWVVTHVKMWSLILKQPKDSDSEYKLWTKISHFQYKSLFLWSPGLSWAFNWTFDALMCPLPPHLLSYYFASCLISYFLWWNDWYYDKLLAGRLWRTELVSESRFLHVLSRTVFCFVNMDHCVCLHFCEQVHFSFLQNGWWTVWISFFFFFYVNPGQA